MALNNSQLHTLVLDNLPDNVTKQISPEKLREVCDEIIDSVFLLIDDQDFVGLSEYNESEAYPSGSAVIYQDAIYQATTTASTTPGPFNPSEWNLLAPFSASIADYVLKDEGIELDSGKKIKTLTNDQSLVGVDTGFYEVNAVSAIVGLTEEYPVLGKSYLSIMNGSSPSRSLSTLIPFSTPTKIYIKNQGNDWNLIDLTSALTTASNGLTKIGTDVELGGTVSDVELVGNGTSPFNIEDVNFRLSNNNNLIRVNETEVNISSANNLVFQSPSTVFEGSELKIGAQAGDSLNIFSTPYLKDLSITSGFSPTSEVVFRDPSNGRLYAGSVSLLSGGTGGGGTGTTISAGPGIVVDQLLNEFTISLSEDFTGGTVDFTNILSGGTDLSDLFSQGGGGSGDITRVAGGRNIVTGGTDNIPVINLEENISVAEINVSGSGNFDLITSGGTDLSELFSTGGGSSDNIYTADGTITGNRTIDGDNKELTFTNNFELNLEGEQVTVDGTDTLIDGVQKLDLSAGLVGTEMTFVMEAGLTNGLARFIDNKNGKGIEYDVDYTVNWTSAPDFDNLLATKKYVDENSGGGSSATGRTGVSSENFSILNIDGYYQTEEDVLYASVLEVNCDTKATGVTFTIDTFVPFARSTVGIFDENGALIAQTTSLSGFNYTVGYNTAELIDEVELVAGTKYYVAVISSTEALSIAKLDTIQDYNIAIKGYFDENFGAMPSDISSLLVPASASTIALQIGVVGYEIGASSGGSGGSGVNNIVEVNSSIVVTNGDTDTTYCYFNNSTPGETFTIGLDFLPVGGEAEICQMGSESIQITQSAGVTVVGVNERDTTGALSFGIRRLTDDSFGYIGQVYRIY